MSTDDLSSEIPPVTSSEILPAVRSDVADAADTSDPMLPPGVRTDENTGPVRYAYYLRETKARTTAPATITVSLMLAAFVAYLVTGPSETNNLILLGVLAVLGAVRMLIRQPREEIGVALTESHVVLGRFPSDTRIIARDRVVSCEPSDRAWLGGEVPAAAASFLVKKLRYLTITCDDGVAYNVAFDAANIWADHLCDVLGGRKELTSPTALVGTPSRKFPKISDDGEEGEKKDERQPAAKPARAARPVAEEPAPEPAEDAERRLWAAAITRHDEVLLAYFPYESDPHLVLTYPAVSDVTVQETASFFDALGEATALRTETYPGEGVSKAYRDSVKALAAAWATAERNAKRAGTSLLDPPDRRRLDQAAKLLRHADGATSPHERASYLGQVKAIVDDLVASGAITAPPRAMMEIERATARAIEAARLS